MAAKPGLIWLLLPVAEDVVNRFIPSTTSTTDRLMVLEQMMQAVTLSDLQELRESSTSANLEKLMEKVLKPRLNSMLEPASGSAVGGAAAALVPEYAGVGTGPTAAGD